MDTEIEKAIKKATNKINRALQAKDQLSFAFADNNHRRLSLIRQYDETRHGVDAMIDRKAALYEETTPDRLRSRLAKNAKKVEVLNKELLAVNSQAESLVDRVNQLEADAKALSIALERLSHYDAVLSAAANG